MNSWQCGGCGTWYAGWVESCACQFKSTTDSKVSIGDTSRTPVDNKCPNAPNPCFCTGACMGLKQDTKVYSSTATLRGTMTNE